MSGGIMSSPSPSQEHAYLLWLVGRVIERILVLLLVAAHLSGGCALLRLFLVLIFW